MAEPTIFEQAWSFQIGGVPVVQLLIVAGVIYLFYLVIFKRGGKLPTFKRKKLEDEVKKFNGHDYSHTGMICNKVLKVGSLPLAYAMSYRLYSELPVMFKNPKNGKWLFAQPNANKATDTNENPLKIQGFRTRQIGNLITTPIIKLLAWLGFGITYYFVDSEFIKEYQNEIVINQNADHTVFNGIFTYGNKAKDVVENIAFKLNRESELEEFINYIPKMNFLETNLSGIAATLREKAEIEKEKYKGQTDE